ncbi:uncharacterized protein LOC118114032 [Hippoglossus stenolepis]|uniref:uncharacterized protein LOC118114032 n=1 Tax=Hippoglossus stenolepis TaxID=195615 RepID=UPI001FAE92F2|nr:uncharacterized protein LOC118114032 [Hippoglossus stenolepis]
MSRTISTRLLQALENLSGNDLERFCFHLRDRREEPKISRREVEDKSPVKIADLLVSKFTVLGALRVVLETLRLIDCNQEAQTLESKTKACVDKGDPKTSNGKLDRKPLQEVENYADGKFPLKAAQQGGAPVMMVKQEEMADHQREGEPSVSQSPMTAQKAQESLSSNDLERFGFHLRNRRDEPKISRRQVEKKSPVEIADVQVTKCTELGALKVAFETLRLMDCNQEAETLESKTKACVDKGDPIFRKTSNGKLDTKPSQEAENYAAGQSALQLLNKEVLL